MGIRYGETIKSYARNKDLDLDDLIGIPLVIAAWFRYLMAVDDAGRPLAVSPDPMQEELQKLMAGCTLGARPVDLGPLLGNPAIFGSNLNDLGLGGRIQEMFGKMTLGTGAVRATLDTLERLDVVERIGGVMRIVGAA